MFDYENGPLELHYYGKVYKNVTTKPGLPTTLTDVLLEDGERITNVYTATGSAFGDAPRAYNRSVYLAKQKIEVIDPNVNFDTVSAKDLADLIRRTDVFLEKAIKEIQYRGYTIELEDGAQVDFTPIERIYRYVTNTEEV